MLVGNLYYMSAVLTIIASLIFALGFNAYTNEYFND